MRRRHATDASNTLELPGAGGPLLLNKPIQIANPMHHDWEGIHPRASFAIVLRVFMVFESGMD
jgi:hypothetical protein